MIRIQWKYLWPYLVFGSTILIVVIFNIIFIVSGIQQNNYHAQLINLAGKQRYLSQYNISSLLLSARGTPVSKEAVQNLAVWNEVHLAIQKEDNKFHFARPDSNIIRIFRTINPVQQEIFVLLKRAYAEGSSDSIIANAIRLQAVYYPAMDTIVSSFQRKAESSLKNIREKQIWVAFFSGLVLILEIILLIIPYHRKLIKAYAELKKNKIIIEKQAVEIQQQVESLSRQKQEMQELHRFEELTLAGINAGVWSWDIRTGQESWSPNFYRILGYEEGEITASYETFINFLLHPEDKVTVEEAIKLHLEHNQKYQVNIRMRTKTGEYKWYDASGLASRDENGNPLQMAGSIIDITDKIVYQNQLEASNQTKNKIFAILSHDLRSPLIGIKGLLDLQTEGAMTQTQFEEYLYLMNDGIGFALRTLDNVLVWSSTQMNTAKINATNFSLIETMSEVEQFLKYLALQKEIKINYSIPASLIAYADPNHIFIITRNLVGNAVKFTPKEGVINISATVIGENIQVTVQDNGVGMEEEFINRLMNRQEHLTTYGTNREKGTGLGVNLILDLLQLNYGKLIIQSIPNKGSTFMYTIPVGKDTEESDITE